MTGDGPAAAVAALSAAVGADPGRGELWSELATALVAAGRASDAWDAAVRAVELAPQAAASHRAIGAAAAALGDVAQAESAYRHALVLDSAASVAGPPDPGRGRHAAGRADALPAGDRGGHSGRGRRRAPETDAAAPAPQANGSRHAAPGEDAPATGRHGIPEPSSGGRRRAPEVDPAWPVGPPSATGGRRRSAEDTKPAPTPDGGAAAAAWPAGEVWRGTAVGLPGWLGPSGARGRRAQAAVPVGATRAADPEAWRRGLVAVVRVEWLVGLVCFLGLAYARTAPYTAGLLAGALVVAGAYGRVRWRATGTLRPPEPHRPPTYAAIAAVATAVVIIPAAMVAALTLARLAAAAAVTCATVAALLLARAVGKDIRT